MASKEFVRGLECEGKNIDCVLRQSLSYLRRQILEHFDLAKYFACIAGASMDETRVP